MSEPMDRYTPTCIEQGSWHGECLATEQYLATWLAMNARPDGLPQQEYARKCAKILQDVLAYESSYTQPPAAPPLEYIPEDDAPDDDVLFTEEHRCVPPLWELFPAP